MNRVYNFSAGPAMLPETVMREAQQEFLDYAGTGMSVIELSHRSKQFVAIAEQAEADLRDLLAIPANYRVLFMQGGATAQFAMAPLNLLRGKTRADYVLTGHWGQKAVAEAQRFCTVSLAADASAGKFTGIPARDTWRLDPNAAYVHYTPNETIAGVEFQDVPDVGEVPLVADMSSNILSQPLDITKFAVIYAGAQKNIGPAGIAIAIVREDLIGHAPNAIPSLYDYAAYADSASMPNTPPTFAWYMAGKVFAWLKAQGGLQAMAEQSRRKADKLYAAIDGSGFYRNPVDRSCRSRMNIPFILADAALDKTFISEAEAAGLTQLAGHRSVGGMRASIYNSMPEAGVDALIAFMRDFEKRYG